jgi:restriction system protein
MLKGSADRLGELDTHHDEIDDQIAAYQMQYRHWLRDRANKGRTPAFVHELIESHTPLLIQAVVEPYGITSEGQLVRALATPWQAVTTLLRKDWNQAYKIPPRIWEEIIAAAFDEDGFDHVELTPRSGDKGRDVIAVRKGIGCIRIIDSVKAYKPGHLVKHDDVRALAGVLHAEHEASKGIITTTSDFAPGIRTDPLLARLMPYRIELMNGAALREWLIKLSK